MELYAPAPKAAPVTAPPETEPRLAHRFALLFGFGNGGFGRAFDGLWLH